MKPSSNRTLLAAAVVTILSAETAFAQLEEVIVTAERREANLQDTPISLEALTEQQIRDRGITNNLDLITEVTGVQGYGSPQGTSSTAFVIRGIGDGAPNISLDPASARYIDGVYISKNQGSSIDVVDLARIEVLKGPQGTLFGRNSTSGAINYISKAPGEEFGVELRATAGNYGQANSSVRVDLPLTDSLRTSVSYFQREAVMHSGITPIPLWMDLTVLTVMDIASQSPGMSRIAYRWTFPTRKATLITKWPTTRLSAALTLATKLSLGTWPQVVTPMVFRLIAALGCKP